MHDNRLAPPPQWEPTNLEIPAPEAGGLRFAEVPFLLTVESDGVRLLEVQILSCSRGPVVGPFGFEGAFWRADHSSMVSVRHVGQVYRGRMKSISHHLSDTGIPPVSTDECYGFNHFHRCGCRNYPQ